MKTFLGLIIFFLLLGQLSAYQQKGIASWYGGKFHGRKTASGEVYNMYQMTAAHKTLPFGTWLKVYFPKTGKTVRVKVNDRGPYAHGRVIDLSKAAASRLGLIPYGIGEVVIQAEKAINEEMLVLQCGAFSTKENARKLANKLQAGGFHPLVLQNPKGLFLVLIEDVPQSSLKSVRLQLKRSFQIDHCFVKK